MTSAQVTRRWLAAWVGAAGIGIANGAAREATYGRRLSEQAAHRVSGATALGALAGYFWLLDRRWPISTASQASAIGGRGSR